MYMRIPAGILVTPNNQNQVKKDFISKQHKNKKDAINESSIFF